MHFYPNIINAMYIQ